MSVSGAFGQLEHARKSLLVQWEATRIDWTDDNARRFEEDVMAPLLTRIRLLELALGRLDVVIRKVHSDCE